MFLKLFLCIMSVSLASAGVSMEVRSLDKYNQVISTAGQKLVLVEFYEKSRKCKLCESLEPYLKNYVKNNEDIILLKVDVDEDEGISFYYLENHIFPTFKFYKGGVEVHKVNEYFNLTPGELLNTIKKYSDKYQI